MERGSRADYAKAANALVYLSIGSSGRIGEHLTVDAPVLVQNRGASVCGMGHLVPAFRPRALRSRLREQLRYEYREAAVRAGLCGCGASAQCRRSWSQHCQQLEAE